jgi:hypothetical protein
MVMKEFKGLLTIFHDVVAHISVHDVMALNNYV